MGDAELRVVGKALRKVDATAKVTGITRFADDLFLPRMLFAKLLRSPHPHARIVSIDSSPAAGLTGVKGVLTGKDLPIAFGILPVSQDEHALALDKVRFVGDPVAAVAATTEEAAAAALAGIAVRYEPLRPVTDAEDALAHPEPRIHDYGDQGNLHKLIHLEFGDVEEAFRDADLVREDTFFFEGSTHLPMEQHAAVADWSADGKLTLWSSTQTPHYVHRALAQVLELSPARIRVIACPNGGGFGGKSDPFSHEIVAAKLAMITGRPVKITLTREEVFYCHRGLAARRHDGTGALHREGGPGLGLEGQVQETAPRKGDRPCVLVLHHGRGAADLLECDAAFRRAAQMRPWRRGDGVLRLDRDRAGLGLDPRRDRGRGVGDRSPGRRRRHGRHRLDARGPGELFESRHPDAGGRGDPGGRARARRDRAPCGREARGAGGAHRVRRRTRVRSRASRAHAGVRRRGT